MSYDDSNIFARILRGEIPNDTIAENDHALAFRDIRPQAPVHVLVIPKGSYVSYDDFAANASDAEIVGFHRLVAQVAKSEGLSLAEGSEGFRAITNAGPHGVQEVPHFHLHLLGGRPLGRMLQAG
ncbi:MULTISPECIES: HIT domain-containing protein [unclassified Paracoccus (in: a-proteobacteria)]|uniref:HIT domain-containing protein n=1 Tax=unclassified Paracoccus (in: a-proteobacteria) TaxID=2688777 RepID=UPI0015FEDF8A|nr:MULTISPECIES: HIT domain-containing protein [unclassified Paracoccus (in: a-proteobacteria)]MBB1490047.1 HIT domain-containing protein [Paracoccus sp. MC1854]MBB1496635.1 HIT domain-containing protein [Paracoccus sp. MC1862]QQO43652.1 HIT domain-containing protein [Paracoccus sp. MC1862]